MNKIDVFTVVVDNKAEFFFFQFSEIYLDIPGYTCTNGGSLCQSLMPDGTSNAASKLFTSITNNDGIDWSNKTGRNNGSRTPIQYQTQKLLHHMYRI